MRATGIVRKLDNLGRVVLPIELRRERDIGQDDPLEISVNETAIILQKYVPRCVFCKNTENVREIMGKYICQKCLEGLRE